MRTGCIASVLGAGIPRLVLLFLWLFTSRLGNVFDTFFWPLLGFLFMPLTTIVYVLVYRPGHGLGGWGLVAVILALLIDLGSYGAGILGSSNRRDY
ncbi:MAG TPA: hypothetical protein ENK24_05025 [Anaerolineae bacterium]|nr:hypothetical protein [Anaerolineae bacterium]